MKNYKDFEKTFIGGSDIATLIMVGCRDDGGGLVTEPLRFGGDGSYYAYIVEGEDVQIGSHYRLVATFNHWLKIYDDDERVYSDDAKEFRIYRAGDYGVILQVIR